MNPSEIEARDRVVIEPFFPSVGWTERIAVPLDMQGAALLAIGSEPDTAELVIDYRPKDGTEKRIVLAFTERGMWLSSKCSSKHPSQDDAR
jgi:hypothetical protein